MKTTHKHSRILALLLCVAMLVSVFATPALADDEPAATAAAENVSDSSAGDGTAPVAGNDDQPEEDLDGPETLDAAEDYVLTFDDAESNGDWQVDTVATSGWNGITLADGALTVSAGPRDQAEFTNGNTIVSDHVAPELADGFVEMQLADVGAGGRIGVFFRYTSADKAVGLMYDPGNSAGSWQLRINGADQDLGNLATLESGKTYTLRIEYVGARLRILLDGAEPLDQTIAGIDIGAGRIGLRTWGYTGNYAQLKVKSLTYDQTPSPEFDEDGNYMVTFTDDMRRGGWQQDLSAASGWNGLSFTDGEGDEGYMTVSAGPVGTGNGNTLFSDLRAPVIDNGFLEMDLTDVGSGGRIGVYFRYT